jgi:hypothetical protein
MHDIRCTEQNPLPLYQNKMEISQENENKEEEKMIPGPKIFTNDGNDNNDNFINNNNNNFVNNNENNFEDNNKNDLIEEPPLDDFPEVFECDKCHELIYESEREDHMLCHQYQNEEDNRINNPRNQIRISKINVEEQKRIEKQIEQNKRKNMINQNQIRQNNSSNNNNRNNNNNYQNIFYNDFGDNILNNNNNNYIPNLNSINNNNNNNPYIRPNNPNRIRNYNNNHINNNNNNNNRQHNRIRPNTGINHYNNNNNINQRVQVTIRQTGPNGEVISRFYPAYDIQNVQNVHRIRRNNNNNNNNNRNNIEHPQPFVYLSSHRNFPFHNINNRQSIGTMFQELFSDLESSGVRATDRDILNELPETNIEDVSKLDSDKKNCVICLEDFKNREKAIILPCIHLFHKNCIKSWLKKNNSCPICKFKLTRDNLMGQNNNFE